MVDGKKEYIERGALIDSFENCYYLYSSTDREIVRQALENAPAADVAPVVHGEWLETNDENKKKCSRCRVIHLIAQYPAGNIDYCPNCGAKMDGGAE